MQSLANGFSNVRHWGQEKLEDLSETVGPTLSYYVKGRAVLHGLPVAAISTFACAYLFQCVRPAAGAIFGITNYIALTTIIEVIRNHQEIDNLKAALLTGLAGVISIGVLKTVCKTSISYHAAIGLTVAAFAGQVARLAFADKDANFEYT